MTDKRVGDALYSDKHYGNVTDAVYAVADALNRIAHELQYCRPDSPLHGSTLGEVYSGLSEIAEAIREATENKEQ
jgi:hypothetical protein